IRARHGQRHAVRAVLWSYRLTSGDATWRRQIMVRRVALAGALTFAISVSANAQSASSGTSTAQNPSGSQPPSSSAGPSDTRPATTTFLVDTGLRFLPTADLPPHGKWSASGYRRCTNYIQGFENIGDFAGTFAFGVKDRAEIF